MVVPNGWKKFTLEELCINNGLVRGPFGGSLKKEIFILSGYKVYEQRNAIYKTIEIGNYYISNEKYKELIRFAISEGDFIISCSGTIGCIYQLPHNSPSGVINQALLKITIDKEKIDTELFLQIFRSEPFQKSIIDDTQGGAMKNLIGMDKFRKVLFIIPIEKNEQKAIATALSETDELITALEKLIAKKRAVKQGTMQELLTGKRRLPGFNGEWIEKSFEELFAISGGKSASRAQLSFVGYPYLHYGDIHGATRTFVDVCADNSIPRLDISLNIVSNGSLLRDGDIVFVDASEDDEGTSRHIVVRNAKNIPFISGLHTIVAKSKTDELNNEYKKYCFQTESVKSQFKFYAVGTKVMGVSKTSIKNITLFFPVSLAEQAAIAQILSDMDEEIDILTIKLNKLRNIKQGMMSELLTGRIRLIETKQVEETHIKVEKIQSKPEKEKTVKKTTGHNQAIEEAVMMTGIVNAFYSDRYLLGRKKVQKLMYLLYRHQGTSTSGFKEKAARPYDEHLRYSIEPLAVRNKYIITKTSRKETLFFRGEKIAQAVDYIQSWEKSKNIQWLVDQFKIKPIAELELLATVDRAKCILLKTQKPISMQTVKDYIQNSDEWKEKLKREIFSDENIARAIKWSDDLFGGNENAKN